MEIEVIYRQLLHTEPTVTEVSFISFSVIHQWLYSPLLGPGLFFSSVIYFTQTVRLLGRGISPSQGLNLNTGQHKHRINAYTHQTSMPWVGFEPTIPVFERATTVHAFDRAATVIGSISVYTNKKKQTNKQTNSGASARQRNKPTERPPLVGEVSANFSG
jgi:hypothetical protein